MEARMMVVELRRNRLSMLFAHTPRTRGSICLLFLAVLAAPVLARDPDGLLTLTDNGGWCWFQDERVLLDGDRLLVGSVAIGADPERRGDIDVIAHDLATGRTTRFELHDRLQTDDHAVPALLVRPDGRYLAVYSKHGNDRLMRWRISASPGDASRWQGEQTLDLGAGVTYSNVFRLAAENGRLYNFHRGIGWNPNYAISDDDGATWRYGGRLLQGKGRPYVKYASNNTDTIHFIATEQHPRDFDNSICHGFVKGGKVRRSDGTPAGDLSRTSTSAVAPEALTRVFRGDAANVAWTTDIHLDREGRPYIAFSVQKNQNDRDHRYYYGRWDGAQWRVHEMAFAGSRLYHPENDYTGLVALDPSDPNLVYISADVDPATGEPLVSRADGRRHFEIFKGVTADGGAHWSWTAITADSTADNIRPIVPMGDGRRTALLWLRGAYRAYTNYDLKVVGVVLPAGQPSPPSLR